MPVKQYVRNRLARLEALTNKSARPVIWLDDGDGKLHGPDGAVMSREEYSQKYPDSRRITLNIGERDASDAW